MATLERAIAIAVEAHAGQQDKNGAPYILHPLRVMFGVQANHAMLEDARIVAALHDVVEDNPAWTLDRLRDEGFSETVIAGVDALTCRENESYDAFVDRAAQHLIGRAVKLADLRDNMEVTRLAAVGEKEQARLDRYLQAYRRLTEQGARV
jgi:(p)ppGpp synthase/HD superfamily hydrolase